MKKNKRGRGHRDAGIGGSGLISNKSMKEASLGGWCSSRLDGRQEMSCEELGKLLETP